jgi:hypothetical protein
MVCIYVRPSVLRPSIYPSFRLPTRFSFWTLFSTPRHSILHCRFSLFSQCTITEGSQKWHIKFCLSGFYTVLPRLHFTSLQTLIKMHVISNILFVYLNWTQINIISNISFLYLNWTQNMLCAVNLYNQSFLRKLWNSICRVERVWKPLFHFGRDSCCWIGRHTRCFGDTRSNNDTDSGGIR